jgi:TRAP transporter TAXI family solute receptor
MTRVGFYKIIVLLLASIALIGNSQGVFAAASQANVLNFITNPAGQGNYTISVAQAQLITKKTGLRIVVQPTQGPKVIPGLLEKKDGDLTTLSSMGIYWAYTGTGEYTKAFKFLRVIQSGSNNYFGVVTREGTGIKSITDLKGKRVTYFVTSLLTIEVVQAELLAYGLNLKDVTLLKAEDTPTALQDLLQKRTDAVCCALGGSKMVEFATKAKLVVLPFEAEKVPLLQKDLPAMFAAITPTNLSGVDPGIPVVATPILFAGRADLDDSVIYQIIKALIENYNEIKTVNPTMAEWKPEVAVQELPIPYHPGAIKYYREKGLWSTKMDDLQQKLLSK